MIEIIRRQGFGRMWIASLPTPFQGESWGFDNLTYLWWTQGKPFDESAFSVRLQAALEVRKPYMAVTPDIVAGGSKSLFYSIGWAARLPKRWPWYLAAGTGMKNSTVAKYLYIFNGSFCGTDNLGDSATLVRFGSRAGQAVSLRTAVNATETPARIQCRFDLCHLRSHCGQ